MLLICHFQAQFLDTRLKRVRDVMKHAEENLQTLLQSGAEPHFISYAVIIFFYCSTCEQCSYYPMDK